MAVQEILAASSRSGGDERERGTSLSTRCALLMTRLVHESGRHQKEKRRPEWLPVGALNFQQAGLPQFRLMKLIPVIDVVQVHGVGVDRTVIGNTAGAKNAFARAVVVNVAQDGGVVFVDR